MSSVYKSSFPSFCFILLFLLCKDSNERFTFISSNVEYTFLRLLLSSKLNFIFFSFSPSPPPRPRPLSLLALRFSIISIACVHFTCACLRLFSFALYPCVVRFRCAAPTFSLCAFFSFFFS